MLALAGPVGWTVAGATLLASIALFTKSKFENREAKDNYLGDALASVDEAFRKIDLRRVPGCRSLRRVNTSVG